MMNYVTPLINSLLQETESLQAVPSPTFKENKRAILVKEKFEEIGLINVRFDTVGNVIGEIFGSNLNSKPIVVSAHLDTVHGENVDHTITKKRDIWVGPGLGDNTIAVAALFSLARYFQENKIQNPLVFCANIAEEGLGNLVGMRALVDQYKDDAKFYLAIEGIGLGVIFNRGLGVSRYKIQVNTEGGHSWGDFGKPSAIHTMASLIHYFSLRGIPKTVKASYNFGKISGGKSVNTIAPSAEVVLDLRAENKQILSVLEHKIEHLCKRFHNEDVAVQIEKIGARPYGEISKQHWLITNAVDSLKNLKISPNILIGSTDVNYPLSLGYPAVCLCLTKGGNVHTVEEYIQLEPIQTGLMHIIQTIQKCAG